MYVKHSHSNSSSSSGFNSRPNLTSLIRLIRVQDQVWGIRVRAKLCQKQTSMKCKWSKWSEKVCLILRRVGNASECDSSLCASSSDQLCPFLKVWKTERNPIHQHSIVPLLIHPSYRATEILWLQQVRCAGCGKSQGTIPKTCKARLIPHPAFNNGWPRADRNLSRHHTAAAASAPKRNKTQLSQNICLI